MAISSSFKRDGLRSMESGVAILPRVLQVIEGAETHRFYRATHIEAGREEDDRDLQVQSLHLGEEGISIVCPQATFEENGLWVCEVAERIQNIVRSMEPQKDRPCSQRSRSVLGPRGGRAVHQQNFNRPHAQSRKQDWQENPPTALSAL